MWFKKNDDEHWERYDAIKMEMNARIDDEIRKLRVEIEARLKPLPQEYQERLSELEVKMAKLWGLLVRTTPTGKESLSKHGRMFGGAARDRL